MWLIPYEEDEGELRNKKCGGEFGRKITNTKFQSHQSYHKKWLILYRGGRGGNLEGRESKQSFKVIISPTPTIEPSDNEIFLVLRKSFEEDKESKFDNNIHPVLKSYKFFNF